jgi:hypothetical protein
VGEEKGKVSFSRPADESLEAYKAFVIGISTRLTGKTDDTTTDEEWEKQWKEFWEKSESKEE